MRAQTCIMAVFVLAACGGSATENETFNNVKSEGVALPVKLAEHDLIRGCKAGAAFRGGRSVTGIDAKAKDEQQVYLSYTRDDGKKFEHDCLVEGNVLRFRMIDEAGPGAGPELWSGKGSTTTYKIKLNSVELKDEFFDGSSALETIQI